MSVCPVDLAKGVCGCVHGLGVQTGGAWCGAALEYDLAAVEREGVGRTVPLLA